MARMDFDVQEIDAAQIALDALDGVADHAARGSQRQRRQVLHIYKDESVRLG